LLSVLQVLLALVALACVVLAEPQNVEGNRPVGRTRIPGRGRFFRPLNPTVVVVNDKGRIRPGPPRNFVRPVPNPAGQTVVIPPTGSQVVTRPAGTPVIVPPAGSQVVTNPAGTPVITPPAGPPVLGPA